MARQQPDQTRDLLKDEEQQASKAVPARSRERVEKVTNFLLSPTSLRLQDLPMYNGEDGNRYLLRLGPGESIDTSRIGRVRVSGTISERSPLDSKRKIIDVDNFEYVENV